MLKRAVLLAFVFLLVSNFWAARYLNRNQRYYWGQSDWQTNEIHGSDFLLDTHPLPVVIVGTSLSARLPESILGKNVYNLAFSGGSLFTGLDLVKCRPSGVQAVVIEVNCLFKKLDSDLVERASSPIALALERKFPVFRGQCTPANLFVTGIGLRVVQKGLRVLEHYFIHGGHGLTLEDAHPFKALLAESRASWSTPPSPEELNSALEQLDKRVRVLRQLGIECIMLEMPVDHSLEHTPYMEAIRSGLQEHFPPTAYHWITPDPDHNYATTDGLHLAKAEREPYAVRILAALKAIPQCKL